MNIIIDPESPPHVAGKLLKKFTFVWLAISAFVNFALITAVVVVSQYPKTVSSPPVIACSIAYMVVFLITFAVGCVLYIRIVYFKNHPLPLPPTGTRSSIDAGLSVGVSRQSLEAGDLKGNGSSPSSQGVEFSHLDNKNDQASHMYEKTHYESPTTLESNLRCDETTNESYNQSKRIFGETEGALSEIARGSLSNHPQQSSRIYTVDLESNYTRRESEDSDGSNTEHGTSGLQQAPREARHYPQYSTHNASRQKSVKAVIEDTE